MKKLLLFIFLINPLIIYSQTSWTYNFDNALAPANHTTGESTLFLPTSTTNGGTARVRVGTGAGSFNLTNPGTSLGSNYELNGVAPTGSSVNKFSIQNFTGAKFLKTSFKIRLAGGSIRYMVFLSRLWNYVHRKCWIYWRSCIYRVKICFCNKWCDYNF